MASGFLKVRYAKMFPNVSGKDNIEYYVYEKVSVNKDDLTGDIISESAAYPGLAIKLSALVDFSPSRAARDKVGLEVKFDALVRIPTKFLTDNSIIPKIGDALILPGYSEKFYVIKVTAGKQGKGDFLDTVLAVKRGVGSRG